MKTEILESYRKLAAAVIEQAHSDLLRLVKNKNAKRKLRFEQEAFELNYFFQEHGGMDILIRISGLQVNAAKIRLALLPHFKKLQEIINEKNRLKTTG
jgi:hypothetical protein